MGIDQGGNGPGALASDASDGLDGRTDSLRSLFCTTCSFNQGNRVRKTGSIQRAPEIF
jgi:hypothetical protein